MVKKGIFCLCMTVLILGGCTLGGVSLKGKEKLAEPDFVLTYAENLKSYTWSDGYKDC